LRYVSNYCFLFIRDVCLTFFSLSCLRLFPQVHSWAVSTRP
jgi:hypothetical protein